MALNDGVFIKDVRTLLSTLVLGKELAIALQEETGVPVAEVYQAGLDKITYEILSAMSDEEQQQFQTLRQQREARNNWLNN